MNIKNKTNQYQTKSYKDAVMLTPSKHLITSTNPTVNVKRYEHQRELSINSMDVSDSITPSTNIFDSPKTITTTKQKQQTKTPAQKRRERRYNLRNLKRTKNETHKDQAHALQDINFQLTKRPICAHSTNSTTATQDSTQQQEHVSTKTENKKLQNTIRVVDFITDSNSIDEKDNIKGLLVILEPSSCHRPNYTLTYVTVNEQLVKSYIDCTLPNNTYITSKQLKIDDTVSFINEILFQFTELSTGEKWYYCHYMDLDYHGNIMLCKR